jgi:hypothetical protein
MIVGNSRDTAKHRGQFFPLINFCAYHTTDDGAASITTITSTTGTTTNNAIDDDDNLRDDIDIDYSIGDDVDVDEGDFDSALSFLRFISSSAKNHDTHNVSFFRAFDND